MTNVMETSQCVQAEVDVMMVEDKPKDILMEGEAMEMGIQPMVIKEGMEVAGQMGEIDTHSTHFIQ